ncbi:MAG TPA: ATP-binding protein, partial [Polyangiaceae bacterium]|nr:ATP-binding protein [Polyangiaceae bacterium]
RDSVPSHAVRTALLAHRSAYVGHVLNRDNLYYVPPELLLATGEGSAAARQGEWMCQQIVRVLKAESARDDALAEQVRLAEQLAELNRGLERRVTERTSELEVANRHLEAFSFSVSHDLRAPLRAIRGFAKILADEFADRLTGEGREHLERVLRNAKRMEELVEGLLSMGRFVKSDMVRTPVDLTALSEEIVRDVKEGEPGRSAEFVVHPGLGAAGDPVLLRAALTNLVGNAWKFTSRRAQTRIEIGRHGDESGKPIFFVRDNGAGFEMQRAHRLFGVFQRLHRAEEYPGSGIGLATVERIIARHGGRIWAEGQPEQGATFYFTLPPT